MSENTPLYQTNPATPKSLNSFKNRPCALPFLHDQYAPPTPDEIGALIQLAGWSQKQIAGLVGVNANAKGSTTLRKWKTNTSKADHRAIPYAAWRLMLAYAGVVDLQTDLMNLHQH